MCACVRACVRACLRACMCVCVCGTRHIQIYTLWNTLSSLSNMLDQKEKDGQTQRKGETGGGREKDT